MNTVMNAIPVPTATQTVAEQNAPRGHNNAISYLRAFITVLVVAHHAVIGYCTFAPPPPASLTTQPHLWTAFPVVDTVRWAGFNLLVGFNDGFFMALMFFLSGLFVWGSLTRKGVGSFVRDRVLRLGLPFAVAAAVVAPLAYYPAYLQIGGSGFSGFWQQWRSLGNWPAGPAWFVWVLLAFDCVAAAIFLIAPQLVEGVSKLSSHAGGRPFAFFGLLAAISFVVYLPMELKFTAFHWTSFGPFFFQTGRVLLYFTYFLIGIGVGKFGIERGLLAPDSKLARRWWLWMMRAVLAFFVSSAVGLAALAPHASPRSWEVAADFTFAISCAASGFFFLAIFTRFAQARSKVWDSLSKNAYGMYLLHYAFVSWLQYALLKAQLPAIAKGSLVFLGAVGLSWGVTAALRRIPGAARMI